MYKISMFFLLLIMSGCSTTPRHVGEAHKTEDGDEYSIKNVTGGFIVAGHYSEYQFVRNSRRGFTGCMRVINSAAMEYADSKNEEISYPKWNEIEIIDHGRDIITAIMNVNCQYRYKFTKPKTDIVQELEKLKSMYDAGSLNESEYEAAKEKLLQL